MAKAYFVSTTYRAESLLKIPDNHTKDLKKIDGLIALIIFIAQFLFIFFANFLMNTFPQKTYYMIMILFVVVFYAYLLIILKSRKQSILSIGLNKNHIPYTITLAITLIIGLVSFFYKNLSILEYWLFQLIAVASFEEILLRGFLYPRLAQLFYGKNKYIYVFLLMAVLFSVPHAILPTLQSLPRMQNGLEVVKFAGSILLNRFYKDFSFSLLMVILYVETENVTYSIIFHALINFLPEFLGLWF